MDEITLPFTMQATGTRGGLPPEPEPDELPPGWVRIPITMQIRLSAAMADHIFHGGPAPGPEDGPDYDTVPHSMQLDLRRAYAGRGRRLVRRPPASGGRR